MTDQQREAFILFCKGENMSQISRKLQTTPSTVRTWTQAEWWVTLFKNYLEEKQASFHAELSSLTKEMTKAYRQILTSKDTKTFNAKAQAIKMYMESGEKPIIDKNPRKFVTNNTLIQAGKIDHDQVSKLTQEELIEMARTGIIPDKVRVVDADTTT